MNRQYIGARYVVKVYENSQDSSSAEWEQGAFEPLVMVTWHNSSYISKKQVPGNVGNPASNPNYWACTGYYNGQILELQNEIEEINDIIDSSIVTPEMYGAVGDGITDDTDALRLCFENNNLVLLTKTYLVDYKPDEVFTDGSGNRYANYLFLHDNITVISTGTIIVKPNNLQGYRLFQGDDNSHITFIGGKFIGDKDNHTANNSEYSHCFYIAGCSDVKLTNCTITKFDGDGIYLGYGTVNTSNVIIEGCLIDDNGRNNISVVSGVDVNINNCILKNPNKYAPKANIDVEPNDNLTDIVVCNINNCRCVGGLRSVSVVFNNSAHSSSATINNITSDRPVMAYISSGTHKVNIVDFEYVPEAYMTETRYAIIAKCNALSRMYIKGHVQTLEASEFHPWGIITVVGDLYNTVFDVTVTGNQGFAYDMLNDSAYTVQNNILNLDVYTPYAPYTPAVQSDGVQKNVTFHAPFTLVNLTKLPPIGGCYVINGSYSIDASGVSNIANVKKGYTVTFDNQTDSEETIYGVTLPSHSITKLVSFADQSLSQISQFTY